jgi:hypothetical protein
MLWPPDRTRSFTFFCSNCCLTSGGRSSAAIRESRLPLKTANMSTPRMATASSSAVWEQALLIAEARPEFLSSTEFSATVVTAATRIASPTPTITATGKNVVQLEPPWVPGTANRVNLTAAIA